MAAFGPTTATERCLATQSKPNGSALQASSRCACALRTWQLQLQLPPPVALCMLNVLQGADFPLPCALCGRSGAIDMMHVGMHVSVCWSVGHLVCQQLVCRADGVPALATCLGGQLGIANLVSSPLPPGKPTQAIVNCVP